MKRNKIFVMEGGGNNPKLLCTIDTDKYSVHDNVARVATIHREVNNVNTLELEISGVSEASQSITETSDIILVDTYGNIQEFHITEIQDVHSLDVSRTIYAELSIGELIDDMITAVTPMPSTTNPGDYLSYIMSFTRWTVGTVDPNIAKSKWEEDLVAKNCLEALNLFIKKYNCEFEVRYTVNSSNKITGRFIDIKKAVGKNIGKRFEYTKDVSSLKRKMDLDNTKTAIYPRIAVQGENSETTYIDISQVEWSTAQGHPVDKPLGQVILTNPTISNMWKRYNTKTGRLQDRVMYAEWTSETAKDANSLISQAWAILKANGVPDVTYEVTACDLYILTGDEDYAHERVGLGDAVVIIDREFQPELRIQTRVMEIEEDLLNPVNNTYVFGKTRENLATGAVNQQQSIEDKLASLASQVGNIVLPEYELPYQSGKAHYEAVKAASQDELIQSNGYVMIEDSDGLWVFDKPSTGNPTKATILKGGCMALARYDSSSSKWIVGTFINGTSVNADYITVGEMNGQRIKAGTIEANRLSVAAVEYVRTGLATDDDLNNAIQDITSVQESVSNINGQISEINKNISNVAQGAITNAKLEVIKSNLEKLEAEYDNMITKVAKVLANEYLPSGSSAMTTLTLKREEYTAAYTAYKNYINTIIADNNVTEEESRELAVKLEAYNNATVNLTTALEGANDAILANVYSKAREGLVTSAELKVNNDKVIIEAQKGMVNTGAMTEAIDFAVKDLVNEEQLTQTVNDATSNLVSTDKLTSEVTASKIEAIKQTFNSLKAEYMGNMKTADLLYADPLLTGTPKSNLNTAKSDYSTKYTAILNAHNDIISKNTLTPTQLNAWSSAIVAYQTASQTLSQRVAEAQSAINAAIADKAVDNINMGAKNILLKSGVEAINNMHLIKSYGVSELLVPGEEYTITVCITPAQGVTHIIPYVSGGWTALTGNLVVNGTNKQIVTSTFKFKEYYADKIPDNPSSANATVGIYRFPKDDTVTTDSTIHWAVLTRGNVQSADWIQAPEDIDANIQDVADSVTALDQTMNGSFKDGIISSAEAKAIEANKNTLVAENADIVKEYNTIYGNANLTGSSKTNLASTYSNYTSAYNSLISIIDSIVQATTVSPSNKSTYTSRYTEYTTALGNYRVALQNALNSIATVTATKEANAAVGNINLNSRNIAYNTNKGVIGWDWKTSVGSVSKAEIRDSGISGVKFTLDKTGYNYSFILYNQLVHSLFKPNTVYTIAMDVKTSAPCGLNVGIINPSSKEKIIDYTQFNRTTVSNTWVRVYATATSVNPLPALGSQGVYIEGLPTTSGFTVEIKNLIVVEGNIDPGWSPAPEDNTSAINDAVKDLPSLSDVTTAQNNAVIAAKIETIKQTYSAIKAEYNSTYKQAETIYLNSYLQDSAKTNLNNAKNDYSNKLNAVTTAYNAIVSDSTLSTEELQAWNTAVTNMQSSATTLGQRMQEAQTYINTAVYNASKNYTDGAIPDALTGYAKESYVDSAKQQAIADAKKGMVSTAQMEVNNNEILMTTASMGQYNLLRNTDFREDKKYWSAGIHNAQNTGATGYSYSVIAKDARCMAGEKAMQFILNGAKANGTLSAGIYQKIDIEPGATYTLSFWIAGQRCKVKTQIDSYDSSDSWLSTLASKVMVPKSGGKDRANWTYDSVTFTCPSNVSKINVHFIVAEVLDYTQSPYMWVVKPMLCTGINAQAWTAHPSEIKVGVVSITEEEGLKVEHSDSHTYTTLTAGGLKVWEYDNSQPLASFGEGNIAYIDTVSTEHLICEGVTPAIQIDRNYSYYFSNTGSGDYSGRDSNNCIAGFTGAMAKMCDDFGISRTHVRGNIMLKGNGTINFFCHGSVHDEDIYLENIYGAASIIIGFVKELTMSGSFSLVNIQCPVRIFGNRGNNSVNEGAVFKRGSVDGIYIKHCSRVEIAGVRITSTQKNNNSGIACVDGSNVFIQHCDIYQFRYGIFVARQSIVYIVDCRGTSGFCGCLLPDTGMVIYRGGVPAGHVNHDVAHNIHIQFNSVRLSDNPAGASPQYSLQGAPPVTSQTVTNSFSPSSFRCVANYTIEGEIRQGSWNGATSDWTGYIYFGGAPQSFLSGGRNSSGQIYLQRRNTAHGYSSAVPVIIEGVNVGTLAQGEGKWFNLPGAAISAISAGNPVVLNGRGNSQYIKFESTSTIRLTTTKQI